MCGVLWYSKHSSPHRLRFFRILTLRSENSERDQYCCSYSFGSISGMDNESDVIFFKWKRDTSAFTTIPSVCVCVSVASDAEQSSGCERRSHDRLNMAALLLAVAGYDRYRLCYRLSGNLPCMRECLCEPHVMPGLHRGSLWDCRCCVEKWLAASSMQSLASRHFSAQHQLSTHKMTFDL